jgi:predicted RNA polymerase sigma factor
LVARPLRHCLKADIVLMSGDASKALEIVAEILTMPELERDMYHSEVHRMWGDLLLINQPEKTEVARTAYELALNIARDQQATTFELRSLASIASLEASEQLDHSTVLAT